MKQMKLQHANSLFFNLLKSVSNTVANLFQIKSATNSLRTDEFYQPNADRRAIFKPAPWYSLEKYESAHNEVVAKIPLLIEHRFSKAILRNYSVSYDVLY
jgi:hypothetical protein